MKTLKYSMLAMGIIFLIFFYSCEKYNCIEGNFIYASEERTSVDFSGIELDGSFDVYVTYDTVTSVIVEGDENLMRYISTSVKANTLEIRNTSRRCLDSGHDIVITVTTPVLRFISVYGSGYINSGYFNTSSMDIQVDGSGAVYADVDCNNLHAEVDGSGEIRLYGTGIDSYMIIDGSGRIRAFDFESEVCYIDIDGSGDAYVFVWDLLDVYIEGSGIVYYKGNPVVRTNDWNRVKRR
jgi:hypothetical protein